MRSSQASCRWWDRIWCWMDLNYFIGLSRQGVVSIILVAVVQGLGSRYESPVKEMIAPPSPLGDLHRETLAGPQASIKAHGCERCGRRRGRTTYEFGAISVRKRAKSVQITRAQRPSGLLEGLRRDKSRPRLPRVGCGRMKEVFVKAVSKLVARLEPGGGEAQAQAMPADIIQSSNPLVIYSSAAQSPILVISAASTPSATRP